MEESIAVEISDNVIGAIRELAYGLEGPAQHLYAAAVHYVFMTGWLFIAISVVLVIISLVLVRYVRAEVKKDEYAWNEAHVILATIGAVLLIGVSIGLFSEGAIRLLSPEWMAIENIAHLII